MVKGVYDGTMYGAILLQNFGDWEVGDLRVKQIPCEEDNQKGKGGYSAAMIASPKALVPEVPPTSRVVCFPSA